MGLRVRVLRVLRRGSEKGVSRGCPERPSESTTPSLDPFLQDLIFSECHV